MPGGSFPLPPLQLFHPPCCRTEADKGSDTGADKGSDIEADKGSDTGADKRSDTGADEESDTGADEESLSALQWLQPSHVCSSDLSARVITSSSREGSREGGKRLHILA